MGRPRWAGVGAPLERSRERVHHDITPQHRPCSRRLHDNRPRPVRERAGSRPARSRIARRVIAVIRAPTVIAIGDTASLAPTFGAIRATADSLGFALQAFARPIAQVVDQAHHAVHFVSRNLVLGYVIIVPGRRPVAVYGPVSQDSLRARIVGYLRIQRALETGGR